MTDNNYLNFLMSDFLNSDVLRRHDRLHELILDMAPRDAAALNGFFNELNFHIDCIKADLEEWLGR